MFLAFSELTMSNELKIQPGKDETAVVERVVPGRLVYVTTKNDSHDEAYGFKLDQLVIRKADGSCRPYRGEPLSELGVTSGRTVVVWGIKYPDVEPTLVIDADRSGEFGGSIGSSISSAVNTTLGKFLR
jgi:hypothetical protein